jgi:hypothetical protein
MNLEDPDGGSDLGVEVTRLGCFKSGIGCHGRSGCLDSKGQISSSSDEAAFQGKRKRRGKLDVPVFCFFWAGPWEPSGVYGEGVDMLFDPTSSFGGRRARAETDAFVSRQGMVTLS